MSNPKGYMPWKPNKETERALFELIDVIYDQKQFWPLSQRYWLYRLMGLKGWEKFDEYSASKYKKQTGKTPQRQPYNLNNIINRGIRAGLLPEEAFSGSRGIEDEPFSFSSVQSFVSKMDTFVQMAQFDRQAGQDQRVVLWMETVGLAESVGKVAHEYGATVLAGQGFDTLQAKLKFADTIAKMGNVLILHAGDLDKSGWTVKESLLEDLTAFTLSKGGQVDVKRILLNQDQVFDYELDYSPAPNGLNRGNHGKGYPALIECQLEAMDMGIMQDIIRAEFESALDMDLLNASIAAEPKMRVEAMQQWIDSRSF